MSTFEEKEQERVGGEGDNKIDRRSVPEMILRKCHFSVNVILFAFTVTLFIDVFYGWTPLKDIPRFRYTDPVLLLSMVWGLMQVAIVSFGKERNVFKPSKRGVMDFGGGIVELLLLVLFDMGMIYLGSVFVGGDVARRAEVSVLRLVLAILLTVFVVAAFLFSEYITIRSDKEERPLMKKEIVAQCLLYVGALALLGASFGQSLASVRR